MRNVVIFAKSFSMEMNRCSFHITSQQNQNEKRLDNALIQKKKEKRKKHDDAWHFDTLFDVIVTFISHLIIQTGMNVQEEWCETIERSKKRRKRHEETEKDIINHWD